MRRMDWCKKKRTVVFKKKYVIVNCKLHIFSLKQLCVFFTPIDSSHYFVYKSIKVRSSKNEYFMRYFIVYVKLRNYFKSHNSKSTLL